jgi:phosphoglycolate phosphatase-like HAD superfamily hydrolase
VSTVLLFDIDGTLVTTGGAGRSALLRALEAWGSPDALDFSFAGMTDRLIVRSALRNMGVADSQALVDRIIADYLLILGGEVAAVPAERYRVHDGMVEALDRASARSGYAIGLGTGNVERGARIKLGRVGLCDRFSFGGFGCDAEDRAELLRIGAARGAARLALPRERCRVVVIGDTPKDIAAAKNIGAEAFAVATGSIAADELAAHHPTHLFDSLAAPGALAALLS